MKCEAKRRGGFTIPGPDSLSAALYTCRSKTTLTPSSLFFFFLHQRLLVYSYVIGTVVDFGTGDGANSFFAYTTPYPYFYFIRRVVETSKRVNVCTTKKY